MTFKENEIWDLESYLGVNKSDHNLEDQIDSLIDQIKLFLNDQSDLRFRDPKNIIAGLYAKGSARYDNTGFVQDV